MDSSHVDRKERVWPRIVIIVLLVLHLAYLSFWHVVLPYFFMGYAYERQSSLGEPAWPTYVWGITQFAVLIPFVLTLYLVIKRNKKYLVTASVAGIGGYLVTQAVAVLVVPGDIPFVDVQPHALVSWGLPMVAVFLYRSVDWIFVED